MHELRGWYLQKKCHFHEVQWMQQKRYATVKLDFKNRQDKNQLGFKNQTANDQLD